MVRSNLPQHMVGIASVAALPRDDGSGLREPKIRKVGAQGDHIQTSFVSKRCTWAHLESSAIALLCPLNTIVTKYQSWYSEAVMRPKSMSLIHTVGKLGTLLLWPIRWLGGRAGRFLAWLRPFFWEEFGRLGLAARRVLTVLAWPLLAAARFVWRGVLSPVLKPAAWWLALRSRDLGRAWRSGRPARQAMRQQVVGWFAPASRLWFRLAVISVAVNVGLVYLVLQLASGRPDSLAGGIPASPAAAGNAPSATPIRLPTATATPSPLPITPAPTPDRLAQGGSVAYVKRVKRQRRHLCDFGRPGKAHPADL